MPDCADAARLSADERLLALASILAAGVLRLRERTALPPDTAGKKLDNSPARGLEVPDETVLSVHTG